MPFLYCAIMYKCKDFSTAEYFDLPLHNNDKNNNIMKITLYARTSDRILIDLLQVLVRQSRNYKAKPHTKTISANLNHLDQ